MDKNAIKKFAVWARRELIARVSQRAAYFDITENITGDIHADSVLGRVMSSDEKSQRQALIAKIQEKGYQQVMEEVAYTWFNRFIALRFMEANGYLPSRSRLFTNLENRFKPQILEEAVNLEFDWLEPKRVYDYKTANDDDGLFKYLIIAQCNAFSKLLPGMFQKISDYTELLFPDNLLREGSVIDRMIVEIPEQDWQDQVQILGWMYQYYNAEPKDKVFADLKKNIKTARRTFLPPLSCSRPTGSFGIWWKTRSAGFGRMVTASPRAPSGNTILKKRSRSLRCRQSLRSFALKLWH